MLRFIRSVTLIQWLVLLSIVATLAAILLPPMKWGSSGQREVAIRVHVLDAADGRPLSGVEVRLVVSHTFDPPPLEVGHHDRLDASIGTTDSEGRTVVTGKFPSHASDRAPDGWVDLPCGWIMVRGSGYGAAAVPVRHESMPRPDVIKKGEIPVRIGLFRTQDVRSAQDGQ